MIFFLLAVVMVLVYTLEFYVMQGKSCSDKISCVMVCGMNTRPRIQIEYFGIKLETALKQAVEASAKRQRIFASEWIRRALVSKLAREKAREIGRARVGKECRSRWSPYH